jgi:hypothetical protein
MLDRVLGVTFGLGAIGSGVYALVAVLAGLPPADFLCELEALFAFQGAYNLVEAWAVTWFHLLAVLAAPLALGTLVQNLRSGEPRPALEGSVATRFRALRRRRLGWGAGLTAVTVAFYVALAAPELLEPISFLARLALVLGPFTVFAGPTLLLDALLAPTARIVVVHQLVEAPEGGERKSLNGLYTLDADEAARVRVGAEVSVLSTRILSSVLSATPLDPYR